MDVITVQMNAILVKIISVACALLLFLAVLQLPIGYYKLLRVAIFIGSIIMIIHYIKNIPWIIVFALIAVLFNPIYPFYLYQKSKWIPIDILVGLLFLVLAFFQTKNKELSKKIKRKEEKTYGRDRMY